jgi:nitronate monooxygenase
MATSTIKQFRSIYPWIKLPLVVNAPMRLITGPSLALSVSKAGGIGFIGPGKDSQALTALLSTAKDIYSTSAFSSIRNSQGELPNLLPVGVGIIIWSSNLATIKAAIASYPPAAVWLFAPRNGQRDLEIWSKELRLTSPKTQIWIQVGSVEDAKKAIFGESPPDVLVLQSADAGGHGLAKGASLMSMIPEVLDTLKEAGKLDNVAVVAAGGIADGRGVASSVALGAVGAAMGTRFLAATEADIAPGYQDAVISGGDGSQNTIRTTIYDNLRGTNDWPSEYDGRGIANQTYFDHVSGMDIEVNRENYRKAMNGSINAWGVDGRLTMYAGTSLGLVKEVQDSESIVTQTRAQASEIWKRHAADQTN